MTEITPNLLAASAADVPEKSGRRVRKIRVKHDTNPFLRDVVANLGDRRVAVTTHADLTVVDNSTGELSDARGHITKMIAADREGFVKLYTAQIDAFFELSKPGRELVKYLIYMHQQDANRHLFYLHPTQALQEGFTIGKTTWYDGISDLENKKIIAASKLPNMFFLNPAVFFNGDRTRLVIEVRKIRKKEDRQAELEARGQRRLVE